MSTKTGKALSPLSPTENDMLLRVDGLCVEIRSGVEHILAVDDVSLEVPAGGSVAIVGESGSGKSTLGLSIIGLLPRRVAVPTAGRVEFRGRDLLTGSEKALRSLRGSEISMIFQDPISYLNPTTPIGRQVREAMTTHDSDLERSEAVERTVELLRNVGIPAPETVLRSYPHEFSGGMLQRVLIAMAIANAPSLLIADEPTTALDVTVQAQIMELLQALREQSGTALILITHNLPMAGENVDTIAVMYGGRIVEVGPTAAVYHRAAHPYTRALVASAPTLQTRRARLPMVPGRQPVRTGPMTGCVFVDRCTLSGGRAECRTVTPPLRQLDETGHRSACHFADEMGRDS